MSQRATSDPARVTSSVARFIERVGRPTGGERVLVGCSGGADSTALVLALSARGIPLHVVYADHGLRAGTEVEAEFVLALARSVGAGGQVVQLRVEPRGNLLARAREARYAALARAARDVGALIVAVGHTETDQAETVAFRLMRGDVPHARAGMPEVRPLDGDLLLIRPLLEARRVDTAAFIAERGLRPIDDPSNGRDLFTRVRLRKLILENPAWADTLSEVATTARGSLAADEQTARQLIGGGLCSVADVSGAADGVLLRLLHAAGLRRAGLRHVRALRSLCARVTGTRQIDLGEGLVATRRYDRMVIGRATVDPGDVAIPVSAPGIYRLLGFEIAISRGSDDATGGASPRWLRNLQPGDFWCGRVGRRKLQDVLVDARIPRDRRRLLPLLADREGAGEVYWMAGLGIAPGSHPAADLGVEVRGFPTETEVTTPVTAG